MCDLISQNRTFWKTAILLSTVKPSRKSEFSLRNFTFVIFSCGPNVARSPFCGRQGRSTTQRLYVTITEIEIRHNAGTAICLPIIDNGLPNYLNICILARQFDLRPRFYRFSSAQPHLTLYLPLAIRFGEQPYFFRPTLQLISEINQLY